MRRLVLLRHASTRAVRRAAFPLDEPLDSAGEAASRALAGRLGRGEAVCSPAVCARATARAAALDARPEPALADWDFGRWRGRTLDQMRVEDPDGVEAWLTDPWACPHGGEALGAFAERVGHWLDEEALQDGRAIAVTHGGVVKAAVLRALGAPLDGFWRIDSAPLHLTELRARGGRWTVTRVNVPAAR